MTVSLVLQGPRRVLWMVLLFHCAWSPLRVLSAEEKVDVLLLEAAMARGVSFLEETQNLDGSWGGPNLTKGLNIYAPVPGAHHAFRAGTSALALSALIDCERLLEVDPVVIERGEAWLLARLPRLRRADAQAIYNVWGHGFGLEALARMAERHAGDSVTLREIREVMRGQIDLLGRYASIAGGWGYYDFDHHTKQPGGDPMSFTTATVLIGLHRARESAALEVPEVLVNKALATLSRQQVKDGSFVYSEGSRMMPRRGINRPAGSMGRSLACFVAQAAWQNSAMDVSGDLEVWLARLFDRHLWLDMARKRPVPHESHFKVAGYFFYYGHYYGALAIDLLPAQKRLTHQVRMLSELTRLQDWDGSWWDFPLYEYHQAYGTGFALQSLARCHPRWNGEGDQAAAK